MKPAFSQAKPSLRQFHTKLHRWYAAHGRKDLPWRNTRDAYAIYVSEIMLQQTQVATVLERYYFPFLKRFPTLAALANAKEQDVLSAWQGLGYYNRAINLHKAAKHIVQRDQDSGFGIRGKKKSLNPESRILVPKDVETLISLPGIGRNTAHAIATFAYRQPVAVMEANVRRVLSRIFALKNPREDALWENAAALLDTKHPFDYNQAMMDIGAMVCKKRAPLCDVCPANALCEGKASPESYPAAKAKKIVPVRRKHIVVQRDDKGRYFATPRESRFLNGLYHFPEIESSFPRRRESSPSAMGAVSIPSRAADAAHWIPACAGMTNIGFIRQQYSHFTLEAEVSLMEVRKAAGKDWYSLAKLKKLPVSMAEKKILELLHEA